MSNLTRDDRLILLMEECAEVIHAATKCLRFGFDVNNDVNDYGRNDVVLACEIGDLLGIIDGLMPWLDPKNIDKHRTYRIERAEYAKQIYGRDPNESTVA